MKTAVLYFSKTGYTQQMAEAVAQGMRSVPGVQAEIFSLEEADPAYLQESCAVVFGTPTYYASTCWQMKKWFDESHSIVLAGKVGAALATADYAQGGADLALQTLLCHMLVKGMLVYSGGSALGQPYIHLGPVCTRDTREQSRPLYVTFGMRIAQKAMQLFGQENESKKIVENP